MTKVADGYTFDIVHGRARLGLLLTLATLFVALGFVLIWSLDWGKSLQDWVILALMWGFLLITSWAIVRSHFISLRTEICKDGVLHEEGALQGLRGSRRLIPWREISQVTVSKGLFGSPDFEIQERSGKKIHMRGFYYERPNRMWAAFKRHVEVVDET
jgi:hypothetical protein